MVQPSLRKIGSAYDLHAKPEKMGLCFIEIYDKNRHNLTLGDLMKTQWQQHWMKQISVH